MRFRWNGRTSVSGAGVFTAPAIGTSRSGRQSCSNNSGARIISCHLGGSSSLCAIRKGCSCANSLGMSPQTGLPHNNRVGDFDLFALPAIMRATGKTLEQVLDDLANRSGLLGLSGGLSNDLRDLEEQAATRRSGRAAGYRCLRGLGAPLLGCLSAVAERDRCDRLHRRHRRKLGRHPCGRVCQPRLVRHRPGSGSQSRSEGRSWRSTAPR